MKKKNMYTLICTIAVFVKTKDFSYGAFRFLFCFSSAYFRQNHMIYAYIYNLSSLQFPYTLTLPTVFMIASQSVAAKRRGKKKEDTEQEGKYWLECWHFADVRIWIRIRVRASPPVRNPRPRARKVPRVRRVRRVRRGRRGRKGRRLSLVQVCVRPDFCPNCLTQIVLKSRNCKIDDFS